MGVTFHERDFFQQPFSENELRGLLSGVTVSEAFAWNSPRAKTLPFTKEDPPPDDELIKLMLETPYLIRRPVIRIGERTFFGFRPQELEAELRR